jgi:hypothetical protein
MGIGRESRTLTVLSIVALIGIGAFVAPRLSRPTVRPGPVLAFAQGVQAVSRDASEATVILRSRQPGDAVRLTVVRVPDRGRPTTLALSARLAEGTAG